MSPASPNFALALSSMLDVYKSDDTSNNDASAQLVKAATAAAVIAPAKRTPKDPASNGSKSKVVTSNVPFHSVFAGTLDAIEFTQQVRTAGMRTDDNGRTFFDKNEERPDLIKLIDLFIGYDPNKDFASQELAARTLAARKMRGGPSASGPERPEIRRAQASISGFVSGIPDNTAKSIANLKARERLAVDQLLEQDKLSQGLRKSEDGKSFFSDPLLTDQEKGKAAAMAQLERDRLVQIRLDLDSYGEK